MLARVLALSYNAMITSAVPLRVGEPVAGVSAAAYNGPIRAYLDVWRPASIKDWQLSAPDAAPHSNLADFEDWAAD